MRMTSDKARNLPPGAIVRGPLLPEPIELIAVVPMGAAVKVIGKGLKSGRACFHALEPFPCPTSVLDLVVDSIEENGNTYRLSGFNS